MKKTLTYLLIGGLIVSSLAVGLVVDADERGRGISSMRDSLVERFNLDEDEVEEFIQEKQGSFRAQRESHSCDSCGRLEQMVEEGSLTEEQRNTLEEKREEIMEGWEDLSVEDRRAKKEEMRGEMASWAEEQGVEFGLMGGGKMKRGAHGCR